MAEFRNAIPGREAAGVDTIDQGLRSYMLGVYNFMVIGLGITGLAAYALFATGLIVPLVTSGMMWLPMLASLGIVLYMSFRAEAMSSSTAQLLFYTYAAVLGAGLAPIFLVYATASIAKVFFITAAAFGALSIYGYTTSRDLDAFRSFLIMGLFGVLIAVVVNLFLASPALDFAISIAGVLVFAGLTAWDTQKIKESYYVHGGQGEAAAKSSIFGALALYLDFINMFLFLLRLFGSSRN